MAMNKQRRTSNLNNIVQYDASGNVTLSQIPNQSTAATSVIVSDSNAIKYRTVSQFYSDLGFPSQTGNNGKILTTDGAALSWATNNAITALTGDVTATGPGSVVASITNTTVTGKILTGLTITGTAVTSADSILTAIGKLQNQVNGLTGTLIYKGSWNAATNTPAITSGVGVAGNFYIVTTAGSTTIDGISSWAIGDWIIFSGSVWQKVPNTNTVTSVNTYTGAVVLKSDDIAETVGGTNKWFTDLRARQAISLTTNNSSGAATYSSTTGILNIPNYTLAGLGGFSNPMSSLGDIIYGGASGAATKLTGNTTASKRYLSQTGDGTNSAAPSWASISDADITYASRTAAYFFAAPAAANGAPTFRAIVATDIPTLNQNTTGQAGSVANSVTFNNAGTGAASGTTFNGSAARTISYNTIGAQGALTLTTTGSSGAATLVGNTLNIPNYSFSITTGNLTEATSSVLTITGGTGAVVGAGTSIQVKQASSTQSGFLSSTDWSTFNGKQNAFGNQDPNKVYAGPASGATAAAPTFRLLVSADIPNNAANTSGNAATATKLETARAINGTNFDGSAAITITANTPTSLTFNNGGAGAVSGTTFNGGTARTISYNTIGAQAEFGNQDANKVYAGPISGAAATPSFRSLSSSDIPALAYLSNSTSSIQSGYFGDIFLYDDTTPSHYLGITNSANLTAARTLSINVNDSDRTISLSGNLTVSAAASISGTNTGDQTNISGNAGTATKWETARSFTIGNTIRTIDGGGNATWTVLDIFSAQVANTIFAGPATGASAAPGFRSLVSADIPNNAANTTGSAASLTTARNINGTAFNGTANITTSSWGTARNITIGATTRSVDGSGNYSWTLADIGAQASGSYVTIDTGQTITGQKTFNAVTGKPLISGTDASGFLAFTNTTGTAKWDIATDNSYATFAINDNAGSPRLKLFSGGGAEFAGSVTATSFFESSDIRYKNVIDTNPVISLDIDLIKFTRTDVDTDRARYGYSAQQVKELMPELVGGDEKLTVNYMDVHSIKIAALEREIKELKAKLYGLE